jgi:hypothetical protein
VLLELRFRFQHCVLSIEKVEVVADASETKRTSGTLVFHTLSHEFRFGTAICVKPGNFFLVLISELSTRTLGKIT